MRSGFAGLFVSASADVWPRECAVDVKRGCTGCEFGILFTGLIFGIFSDARMVAKWCNG